MEEIDGRIIILILFVVISAIKWLIEKIKGPVTPPAEEHEISKSIENLYDDFREEIRQRQTKTHQRPEQQTPPPLPPAPTAQTRAPLAPAPPMRQSYTKKPEIVVISAEQKAAAARFQQRSTSKPKASPQSYVRTLLSHPQATRQAIILTEILGKPKSLQNS